MVDDRPEDNGSSVDSDRPKRAPPTIDLEATKVSSTAQQADGDAPTEQATEAPAAEAPASEAPASEGPAAPPVSEPAPRPVSPWIIAPVSGVVAAALVIGVGWMLGWPAIQPADSPVAPVAAIDGLTARIAALESKASKPSAPTTDPAAAARAEILEKSLVALRLQSEKLAAAVDDVKAAPRRDGAAGPDLAAVNERIAGIEKLVRAQGTEIAQQGSKIAAARSAEEKAAETKPADDVLLRRVVAGALLDVLVRIGDPYQAALGTAKSLAPNPDALKPLDEFAAKGVPSPGKLSGELLALVPKLTPAAQPEHATGGAGIVERLQAGAAKLVRIERTDTAGNDRGAVVARVTAAALRNDSNEARRELKTLEPADRAAAQSWLERADARDAALAASRQFATDAMTVLAKPAQ